MEYYFMILPAEQNNFSYYSPIENTNQISNAVSQRKLNLAKTLMYRENIQGNPQAANYILMAEKALKNGNSAAADNFAERALQIIKPPENAETVNLKKPDPPEIEKHESTEHSYQDVSNDAGVSFSSPSKLTGPQSFIAVPAHEKEHVSRRVSEAVLNGDRILVSVSYKIRYDYRTGEAYMAGGTTRTIRFSRYEEHEKRKSIDLYA
jgi:hypothetical protein